MFKFVVFQFCFLPLLIKCDSSINESSKSKTKQSEIAQSNISKDSIIIPDHIYTWLSELEYKTRLINIPTSTYFTRLDVEERSFASWLRYIPLKKSGEIVYLYDGQIKYDQSGVYRVLDIDIGKRDLQQCADAVMRLRAEYLYASENYEEIQFNYTNGVTVRYDDWAKGRKPFFENNRIRFSSIGTQTDYSYKQFRKYLTNIFIYAGSSSLEKELTQVTSGTIFPGDVFIQGGFPGHAIIVLDVAVSKDGSQQMLLAQSYMPAQSIHVLKNPNSIDGNPWFDVKKTGELRTPDWLFNFQSDHYRFSDRR